MVVVGVMCAGSLLLWLNGSSVVLYGCCVALALVVIVKQVVVADDFWQLSMSLDSVNDQAEQESGPAAG
jgi:hypothetical protein